MTPFGHRYNERLLHRARRTRTDCGLPVDVPGGFASVASVMMGCALLVAAVGMAR